MRRDRSARAFAVIGAGFGDEGKGAAVDALVDALSRAGHSALVIRANGGAQAAHTVVAGASTHVFGHFGSGTLLGAPTWLGPRFVHNPPLFLKELEALRRLGARPRVLADPRGPVTLPVDVAVNQTLETARGRGRHGSCGVGFGEAVGRSEDAALRIVLDDLWRAAGSEKERARLLDRVCRVSKVHGDRRTAEAGLTGRSLDFIRLAAGKDLAEAWLNDALQFAAVVEPLPASELSGVADHLVFEGAQGLLLDRDAPFFPHVTRSRTGSANIVDVAREAGITRLDTLYCTRAYATRHGAGPLPGEGLAGFVFEDRTNVPNPYQDTLRFAPLSTSLLGGAIAHDIALARRHLDIRPRLCVSCLDQTDGRMLTLEDGGVRATGLAAFAAALGCDASWGTPVEAWGPDRSERNMEPIVAAPTRRRARAA